MDLKRCHLHTCTHVHIQMHLPGGSNRLELVVGNLQECSLHLEGSWEVQWCPQLSQIFRDHRNAALLVPLGPSNHVKEEESPRPVPRPL